MGISTSLVLAAGIPVKWPEDKDEGKVNAIVRKYGLHSTLTGDQWTGNQWRKTIFVFVPEGAIVVNGLGSFPAGLTDLSALETVMENFDWRLKVFNASQELYTLGLREKEVIPDYKIHLAGMVL